MQVEGIAITDTAFRDAMTRFASGVTIVTTRDESGAPWGFTASAFCSLSLNPPLVLVCLDKRADCYPIFERRQHFLVSILRPHHRDIAIRFATKGGDKFAERSFLPYGDEGLPTVPDSLGAVMCRVRERHDGGDHMILVGAVESAETHEGQPLIFFERSFWSVGAPREDM